LTRICAGAIRENLRNPRFLLMKLEPRKRRRHRPLRRQPPGRDAAEGGGEEILKRFGRIEVVGPPRRLRSNFVKGYEAAPVRIVG
jgi:hypothetical protein